MHRRTARALLVVGVVLAAVGLIGAIVFQLQPWRTCPDDTSPAACPMLPADYDAFLLFVLVLVAGVILLVAAGLLRMKGRPRAQRGKPRSETRSS